jgi:hypothetical protein
MSPIEQASNKQETTNTYDNNDEYVTVTVVSLVG